MLQLNRGAGMSLSRCWLVEADTSWLTADCCSYKSCEGEAHTSPPSAARPSPGVWCWGPGRAGGPAAAEDFSYLASQRWRWNTVWLFGCDTAAGESQSRHSGRSHSQHCPPSPPCASCGHNSPQLGGPAGGLLTGISSHWEYKAGTDTQSSLAILYICSAQSLTFQSRHTILCKLCN